MKEVTSLSAKERPVKKTAGKGRINYLPVITFFIVLLLILITFACYSKLPFGRFSILRCDLKDQYVPELLRFKHQLKELDLKNILSSFSYSTSAGCGSNFMSTFGYYLSSPLNFIVFLFDDAHIATAISIISAIRLALGSAFMCLFLQKRSSDTESKWPLVFAITYAFSSYTISFLFNIMWFDAYMLLPLLLYFIERFIEEDRKTGIVFTLIVLFISNFYASYMAGIFSFFYLIGRLAYLGLIENKTTFKNALAKTCKFIITAILCALSAGAFLIPVGLDVLNNRDAFTLLINSKKNGFEGIEFLSQMFLGYNDTLDYLINNQPFVFISLSVTILVTVFFVSKAFSGKDKLFYGIVIILFFASFNIPFIDKLWQASDRPNWFQHRQAFVFMPVFISLAFRVFKKIKEITYKEILSASGILMVILLITQFAAKLQKSSFVLIANVSLMIVYSLLFMAVIKKKWPAQLENFSKISYGMLVMAIVLEMAGIAPRCAEGTSVYLNGASDAEYRDNLVELQALSSQMSNNGARVLMETDNRDSEDLWIYGSFEAEAALGRNGISQFDSGSNRRFARLMKQFGYRINYNYATYDCTYTSLPSDAFFSVGNMVTTSGYKNGTLVSPDDDAHRYRCYQNTCVLPVGFAADDKAMDFDLYYLETLSDDKDYFDFQNRWYKSMFPDEFTEDIFVGRYAVTDDDITLTNAVKLPDENIDYTFSKTSKYDDPIGNEPIDRQSEAGHAYYRSDDSTPAVFTIKHTATHTGEQYIAIVSSSLLSHFNLSIDGEELMEISPNSFYSIIVRLGYYEEGEEIEVVLDSSDKCFSFQDIFFAAVDSDAFKSQFEKIDLGKVTVDTYKNGNAVFTTNLGPDEVLLTTIPYENGWTCYIDGKETGIQKYGDILMAADPGEGTHTVEFRFTAPGIKAGIAVSAAGIVMLAAFVFLSRKRTACPKCTITNK